MSLSDQARFYMDKRDNLTISEKEVIRKVFMELRESAELVEVPVSWNDTAAELEAALIKFIIESREG